VSIRARAAAASGALLIALTSVGGVAASSHREAPLIAGDPAADNTDLYAFVSPDDPTKVTIIANYIPLEEPAGGPNFNEFDPAVRYEIHVDNNGDARDDITYRFNFNTRQQSGKNGVSSFLYNNGPVTTLDDVNLLARQTYTVTKMRAGLTRTLATGLPAVPTNVGPRSVPDYAALAATGVRTISGGVSVYAGPRDDAFFVDLGSIFDLGGLRPFNNLHILPLPGSMASPASTPTRSRSRSRSASSAATRPIRPSASGPVPAAGLRKRSTAAAGSPGAGPGSRSRASATHSSTR